MGHSKASKAITHTRLLEAAASRFKERGVDGISLADLMKDLKLTHGGFYRHFDSRDALVAEALDHALDHSSKVMKQRLFEGGNPALSRFVDFYLDELHRDERADGCAVAALAGDAARKSPVIQAQFRSNIERNIEALASALGADAPGDARETAIMIISVLYGALIVARAVGDSPLSREVLETARKRVLGMAAKKARGTKAKK